MAALALCVCVRCACVFANNCSSQYVSIKIKVNIALLAVVSFQIYCHFLSSSPPSPHHSSSSYSSFHFISFAVTRRILSLNYCLAVPCANVPQIVANILNSFRYVCNLLWMKWKWTQIGNVQCHGTAQAHGFMALTSYNRTASMLRCVDANEENKRCSRLEKAVFSSSKQ